MKLNEITEAGLYWVTYALKEYILKVTGEAPYFQKEYYTTELINIRDYEYVFEPTNESAEVEYKIGPPENTDPTPVELRDITEEIKKLSELPKIKPLVRGDL